MLNLFKFIEDEIEVRVESLKYQLDEVNERVMRELDSHASILQTFVRSSSREKSSRCGQLMNYDTLSRQNYFEPLRGRHVRAKSIRADSRLIGQLSYKFEFAKLQTFKLEKIDLEKLNKIKYPMGMCVLDNGKQLAIADYHNNNINIFDNKMQIIDSLLVNAQLPHRIEVDESSSVFYVQDKMTNFVYLHNIKTGVSKPIVINQSNINDSNEAEEKPVFLKDICYYDKCLFALNYEDKNLIHRFDRDGNHLKSISIKQHDPEQEPKRSCSIRVSDRFIAVNDSYLCIKLYDHNGTFKFMIGSISDLKFDCFTFADDHALLYFNSGIVKCYNLLKMDRKSSPTENAYDAEGEISSEQLKCDASFMCYFNNRILIAYPWKKQLGILS